MKTITILLIEDNHSDARLIKEMLKDVNYFKFELFSVLTLKEGCEIVKKEQLDIILLDLNLPDCSGRQTFQKISECCNDIPIVLITGNEDEELSLSLIKEGAQDYLTKQNLNSFILGKSILYSIERMQSEMQLRKLSLAVEQSPVSIILTDKEGNVDYANPKALEITGYKFAEISGKNPRIFSSGEKPKEDYKVLWETITSGKEWRGEFHNKKKNGELYWEMASISPIINEKGEITHYLAVKEDITEHKQILKELIIAKEKAEESDRLKTAFLHNISHEIRTPINAIEGFSNLLNEPDLPSAKIKHFTEIIIQSSEQLLSIINNIVKIATIEAGQEKIFESSFNINSTLKLLYDQFLLKATKQNITLGLKSFFKSNDMFIISDETKLVQVLTNLIGNALKFTKHGYVNFGCIVKDDKLEFFVEDTGIGISDTMFEDIFKRFRQVESTTSRQFGGSGLGLSISKAYIELLGGKMWLNSELDKGSTFYFTIPLKMDKINSIPEKQSYRDYEIENKKVNTILIAEDEDSNFILLVEYLSSLNINIIRAKNGFEAVEICKSNQQIDLILMDIKMPIMDGYEATKYIKEFMPNLPIIAQTAYTSEADKNKAISCGCTDFISKPFNKKQLLSKILKQI